MYQWCRADLIDGSGGGLVVVLGHLKAVEDAVAAGEGGDLDGVARGEEGRAPVVDEALVDDDEPLDVVEPPARGGGVEGD